MKQTEKTTDRITLSSTLGQVESRVPGIRQLLEGIGGKRVPNAAWRMARRASLKLIFKTKLGWKNDELQDLEDALNAAKAAGGTIPEDYVQRVTGSQKSLIQKAEERDLWSGHNIYFERVPFDDLNMGFYTLWALACASHRVTSVGEVLHTISQIDDGNTEQWKQQWTATAERVENRAEGLRSRDRSVSSRDAYMRAAYYYRLVAWVTSPRDEAYRTAATRMRECFRSACELFSPQMEVVSIPYEAAELPGYFLRPDTNRRPRPTVIVLGGGETFAEDSYFLFGPTCTKYGYNFFTFEYPGEGLTPFDGLFHRPDIEGAVSCALDHLVSRADVDTNRIATYGVSQGGYVGPRAAIHDDRIAAVVANSFLSDMGPIFKAYEPILDDPEIREQIPSSWEVIQTVLWRWGGRGESGLELIELTKPFVFDPADVPCPVLIVIGEGEYRSSSLIRSMQHEAIEKLPDTRSTLVIGKAEEGMAHHCTAENPDVTGEIVFEWLDGIFQR